VNTLRLIPALILAFICVLLLPFWLVFLCLEIVTKSAAVGILAVSAKLAGVELEEKQRAPLQPAVRQSEN
jgi:hypothetical protein